MTLQEIYERDKTEHARSMELHGKWTELPKNEQYCAISGEFYEWERACQEHDINSEHGEINELIHLRNVAARRIMYLTGESHA